MSKELEREIGFQIKTIELLDTSLHFPIEQLENNTTFQFDLTLEHRVSLEANLVIVICNVTVLNELRSDKYGHIRSSCIYTVNNLDSFVSPETQTINLPVQFLITLNSVSISNTRGLMFAIFRGTFLHNAILPIIDPQSFVPEKK